MVAIPSPFERSQAAVLAARLAEPRRFIQVVAGPRQVGKTTLVHSVVVAGSVPHRYASADAPGLQPSAWLEQQWDAARIQAAAQGGSVLVLDEIQKLPGWSAEVKRLWDEDTRRRVPLKVVLLGSAPLLIARGLAESLAGRFEVVHLRHWSLAEMRAAFGWDWEQWVFFGGYPGAAPLIGDELRWAAYVNDSLVETSISRDVLMLSRVDKPALMRRLFELGCRYSGQVLSFTKMLGTLQDAGNTVTLAHYLELLDAAGMMTGLGKWAGDAARRRGSSPKLQAYDNALVSATAGLRFGEVRSDPERWGRLVESAVGAHLAAAAATGACELFWWRDRDREVDFVARRGGRVTAIEVKRGRSPATFPGMAAFVDAFRPARTLLVGGQGIAVDEFLSVPAVNWLA
ncbi:MAG: ATP-binding protein [Burkholderiales bacterium]